MKTTRLLAVVAVLACASVAYAGWRNPAVRAVVIQTFTTYQPITGNNTGTIVTNSGSIQLAGDNSGFISITLPGDQYRGVNAGAVGFGAAGAAIFGNVAMLATATNAGAGSMILANLTSGQSAAISALGSASLLLGAGTVTNAQSLVIGDGNTSHGARSATADTFWATGAGFYGNASGLTNFTSPLVIATPAGGSIAEVIFTNQATGKAMKIYADTHSRIFQFFDEGNNAIRFSGILAGSVVSNCTFDVKSLMNISNFLQAVIDAQP